MAHPRLQWVRERYGFRCGYCGVAEVDTGSELTVDHFYPVSAGGDDSDDNLVYACIRCNQHKSDLIPDATRFQPERRLLHPLYDNIAAHIRENRATGLLEPLTATGQFHIAILQLNRPLLTAYRQKQHRIALLGAQLENLLAENAELHERLLNTEQRFTDLEG